VDDEEAIIFVPVGCGCVLKLEQQFSLKMSHKVFSAEARQKQQFSSLGSDQDWGTRNIDLYEEIEQVGEGTYGSL
jgi:hypothetical protein